LPEDHANPADGVQRFKEKRRERWATPKEVAALAKAIDEEAARERWTYGKSVSDRCVVALESNGSMSVAEVAETVGHPRAKTARLLAALAKRGRVERIEKGVYRSTGKKKEPHWSKDYAVYVQAALWLYLLTGLRKNELLSIRWAQVDFDRRVLFLPDTKAGRSHEIPLSLPAIEILRGLPRQAGNPHVFCGHRPGQPLVSIDKSWRRIRKRAGVEDVRIHDLRRTVGSWLVQAGNSLLVVQKALNHSTYSAALVYARMSEDPVRRALDEHARQVMVAAGKESLAEVIPLHAEEGESGVRKR
jgi:integrase